MTDNCSRLRVIDFGFVPAIDSQAVYHGIAEAMRDGDTPVLTLVNPSDPYVCVGLHQDIDKEVDRDFCTREGVAIVRRHVGGGAVYLDSGQMFFHFIYPSTIAPKFVTRIYEQFIAPVVATYRALGVEATFRPVNDIHVNGRKIGGTGAATIGDATLMVGSFLFDFPIDKMAQTLKVPSEKFRDKLHQGLKDYMTTLTRELGTPPDREVVKASFLEQVAAHLHVAIEESSPTAAEAQAIRDAEAWLSSSEWTDRPGKKAVANGVKIAAGTHLTEGVHKAPGGLIRVELLTRDDRIAALGLSGDFTVFPPDGMQRLAEALLDQPLEKTGLEAVAGKVLEALEIDVPGVTAADVTQAILSAMPKDY
ncbi:MAG: lipoate--protein ligase [Thioalkalivibrionaceae bacterium]